MGSLLTEVLSRPFLQRAWGTVRLFLTRVGRFLHLLTHRFVQDGGLHHTASLTYTTLLSLVPLMTVSLALFSAFPVGERVAERVQDFVFKNFVPASSEVIHTYLIQFSDKASRLTGTGTLFLVVVAVLMMANIDQALNTIWQVRRRRKPLSLFMVYWAILSLGPILMGISVAISSYLMSITPLLTAATSLEVQGAGVLSLMPPLASALAFTLLYIVVPNRTVPLGHALAGGLLATLLFELAKEGFAAFITAFPTYEAIYGALATVPVFLIWIYLSWLVTLLGAEFTYCLGIYRDIWRPDRGGAGNDLLLAYRVLGALWDGQRQGQGLAIERLLEQEPGHPEAELEQLLMQLEKARLVLRGERGEWILVRDLRQVSLLDLFRTGPFLLPESPASRSPELDPLLAAMEQDLERSLAVPLDTLYQQRSGSLHQA